MILKDICQVDWGNTDLTKASYVENGEYLAVSAAGCDGRINHYECEANVPVLSAIGAQCGKMFFPNERFTAIKNTITLTPKDGVLGKYLYYLFTAIELPKRGAGQPFISKGDIEKFGIPKIPPISIQQKIVTKLDAIFAEIDKATVAAETNVKNAEALFQSFSREVFGGDSDWRKSTIGEALFVIKNGVNCEQNKIPIGNKITRIETIAKKKFDFERVGYATLTEDEKERAKLLHGDILFSHINSPIHVGKTAIYEAQEEIYHGINLLLMRTIKDVNPYFFNFFLNQLLASGYWEKNCKKSVNQASVNQKDISKVEFKFPNLEIQEQIVVKLVALLEEVDKSKNSYTSKVSELSNLKKSILNQAFAGNLLKE